jgi:hypothetical protein
MAFDMYSTAAQLAAIEQLPREYNFLLDEFVQDRGAVEDDRAIYDYRKGDRVMAPMIHENTGDVPMPRDSFVTQEFVFPTIAPSRVIEVAQLKSRSFGEAVYGSKTPEQRAREMLARDLMDMRAAITRRKEWMVRQILLTGKMEVFTYTKEGRNKYATKYADYGFTNNYTPQTPWNQAGSDPDYDMQKMFDLVYNGNGFVDTVLVDPKTANVLKNNDKFMKQLDIRNYHVGELNPNYIGAGVRRVGVNSDGVEILSYAGTYVDDDGVTKPNLPDGTVICLSKKLLSGFYGPVTQVEDVGINAEPKTYIAAEVPLRWGSIDDNSIKNRLISRPTFVPFNVDAWAVASVL